MYLLAKYGDCRSYRYGDINYYIKSYLDTLENAELTVSIRHIGRLLKSGIPIYNSEVPDMTGRKTRRRRRTQAITKRFAFHTNAIKCVTKSSAKTSVTTYIHATTYIHVNIYPRNRQ